MNSCLQVVLHEQLDVQLEALGVADGEISVLAEKNTSAIAKIECVTSQNCTFRVPWILVGHKRN
jgi:hypothetical protein